MLIEHRFHTGDESWQFGCTWEEPESNAKMAGATTRQAIAEWIRLRSCWLQEVLPETRVTFPCAATISQRLASDTAIGYSG